MQRGRAMISVHSKPFFHLVLKGLCVMRCMDFLSVEKLCGERALPLTCCVTLFQSFLFCDCSPSRLLVSICLHCQHFGPEAVSPCPYSTWHTQLLVSLGSLGTTSADCLGGMKQ